MIDWPQGRNLLNNDLRAVQDNLDRLMMVYLTAGPFVAYGMEFTLDAGSVYDMSAGAVFLNGRLIEVPAQQINLSASKAIGENPPVDDISRPYSGLAVSKPGIRVHSVGVTSGNSPTLVGENLFIPTPKSGFLPQIRRLRNAIQELTFNPKTILAVRADIVSKFFSQLGSFGQDEWLGWQLLTAAPSVIDPADLRDTGLVGAGGAFSVNDTQTNQSPSGSGVTSKLHAVHYVEFTGTQNEYVTVV